MIHDRMKPSSSAAARVVEPPIPEINAMTPPILAVFNVLREINSARHLLCRRNPRQSGDAKSYRIAIGSLLCQMSGKCVNCVTYNQPKAEDFCRT
jgi:hypothetical protein